MSQELAIIEDITEEKWPEVYGVGKVNSYYEKVKQYVNEEVPDTSTAKGRAAIASLAGKVSSSKKAVENPGRDYLRKIKELPKTIETELREFVILMDKLRDDTRQPLTDWEAEQARIKAEEEAKKAYEALLLQIENDHEIALLLNEKFDRERAEALALAEQQRKDHEARIAREAAELATRQAEDAAAKAIRDAQLEAERAQREKAESEARALQAKLDAEAREAKAKADAELATKLAAEKAERDRLQAIADTEARIAREKAAADAEAAKLAANKANQKRKNNEALDDLIELGCAKELATAIVVALAKKTIRNCSINY